MKILIYAPEVPFLLVDNVRPVGGITVELYSWIKGFKANDIMVGILTWEGAEEFVSGLFDGIDFIEGFKVQDLNKPAGLKKRSFAKAINQIIKFKPDLIFMEGTIDIVYFFSFISKLLKVKFIYRLASDKDADERVKSKLKGINYNLYMKGLKYSYFISTQNRYQLEHLKKKFPSKKIFCHHNPFIITEDFIPYDKSKREYIAWAGNFRKVKNLRALYETANKCPDINFKIAGTDTPETDEETKNYILKLKQLNNVEFIGYLKRTEISNFFSKAYALLNTSHFEGFSNTFLEAWAAGTPVISTIYVNPDNIISDKGLGFTADNFETLSDCINILMKNSVENYKKLSEKCRAYVVENHNPKNLAARLIKELEED